MILKNEKGDQIDLAPGSLWPGGGKDKSMQREFKNELPLDSWTNGDPPSPQGSGIVLFSDAGNSIISLTGKEITLDASGSTGNIKEYFWNFGDGATTKGKIVTHKYNFSGKYIVSLMVSDGDQQKEDIIEVTIFSDAIFISEFLPNPIGDDSSKEWIEVVNESKEVQNISGWGLGRNKEKPDFIFPTGTYLASQNFLLLSSSITKISLPNKDNSLFLFYPSEDICQEIKYEEINEGHSVARKGEDYFYTKTQTMGMPNIISGEE